MTENLRHKILELLTGEQTENEFSPEESRWSAINGITVGVLFASNESGNPRVAFDARSADEPVPARSLVALAKGDVGRQVCLMFEQGKRMSPIIMGFIRDTVVPEGQPGREATFRSAVEGIVDGERVVLEGKQELMLKCGEGSITLRSDGKIIIKGTHLLSRSSGPNRIKGGSVQIN